MVRNIEIVLPSYRRGFHLITGLLLKELGPLPENGILHVFICHTSAALTINENADPTVLADFEASFNRLIPENAPYYRHTSEGADDMPAHIKASVLGASVSVPIRQGRLCLGTWQGIYLCEFRNNGGKRRLILSLLS